MPADDDRIELSEVETKRDLVPDVRHATPEPPPVRLLAIADVSLPAPNGVEKELDAFYIALLGFVRDPQHVEGQLRYRAEKHTLAFRLGEPPVEHTDLSPTELEVPSLHELTFQLIEREIEFERHRGIYGGDDRIVLKDPAGNWVAIGEQRLVS